MRSSRRQDFTTLLSCRIRAGRRRVYDRPSAREDVIKAEDAKGRSRRSVSHRTWRPGDEQRDGDSRDVAACATARESFLVGDQQSGHARNPGFGTHT
jgi:hypothetical protein